MNLCDRLQRRTPVGYGQRFHFQIRGVDGWDKSGVIFEVAERFSRLHGPLTHIAARKIYERLASKYCPRNAHAALRSLSIHDDPLMLASFAHPKELATKALSLHLARQRVKWATDAPDGDYGIIQSACGECALCGGPTRYTLISDRLTAPKRCDRVLREQNKYRICRNAMCKAIAEKFPSCCANRRLLPMAFVLMEITKNGDRSGVIDDLKEIAARDVYRVHNRRGRQARGESDSQARRSVPEIVRS